MSRGLACTERRLHTGCLCHIALPSYVILMTARPRCICSAAGNQSPTPGLAVAQISKQVQLCWLALSLLSACGCAVSPCEIQTWWVTMLLLPPESQWDFGSLYKTQTSSSKLASLLSFRDTSWGVQIPLSPPSLFPSRHGSLGGWTRCVCSSSPLYKTNWRGLWVHDKAGTGSACCQRDSSIKTSTARCA